MLAGNPCLLSKVGVSKVGNRCVQCWAGTSKLGCLRLILQMHLFGREMFQACGTDREAQYHPHPHPKKTARAKDRQMSVWAQL